MDGLDILHCVVALVLCGWALSAGERPIALYPWWSQAASACAVVTIHLYYYDGGEMVNYFRKGISLAAHVELDHANHPPPVVQPQRCDAARREFATTSSAAI